MKKQFTIWLVTYGVPRDGEGTLLFVRAVKSLLAHTDRAKYNLFVGMNAAKGDDAARLQADAWLSDGVIDRLYQSDRNIAKEGMFTLMLPDTTTEFVVRMDDDTHVKGDWLSALEREIEYDTKNAVHEWGRASQLVPVVGGVSVQMPQRTALGADDIREKLPSAESFAGVLGISGGFVCTRTKALHATDYPHNDFAPIYAEDNVHSMALEQYGFLRRNIPAFWSKEIVAFGDERGVGSRTNRAEPREIFDGSMTGITIHTTQHHG